MTELERRVAAVEATKARFAGKAFSWGRVDCAKVGAFHLRQMGHHAGLGLHKAGTYRSALTAKRALARAGHDSIAAALDAIGLERIAPAAAWTGDVLLTPGDDTWEALAIVVGNGAVLGFHQDLAVLDIVRVFDFASVEAWRL